MPTFYADDYDIDPDEYLSACSYREKEEIIDSLIEDGYLKKDCRTSDPNNPSIRAFDEQEFEDALLKLSGKWNMISLEESNLIVNLAKKF